VKIGLFNTKSLAYTGKNELFFYCKMIIRLKCYVCFHQVKVGSFNTKSLTCTEKNELFSCKMIIKLNSYVSFHQMKVVAHRRTNFRTVAEITWQNIDIG